MASDQKSDIPVVDVLPPSRHGSVCEKWERTLVELVFKIPDTGPYEESHQEMIKGATKGVNESIKWNVTRTYGCPKGGKETENKLITVCFQAKYEGLNELTTCVKTFKNELTSLESSAGSKREETEAQLIFYVPDEGKAYTDEEVGLIQQASLGHSWTVSRSYGSDAELKKIEFKIHFQYEVTSESQHMFPGLNDFTTTLKRFIEKFTVIVGSGFQDDKSVQSESKYVIRNIHGHLPQSFSQLSLNYCRSRSSSDGSVTNNKPSKSEASVLATGTDCSSSGTQSRPHSRDQELRGKSLFLEKLIELRRVEGDKTPWVAEDTLGFNITLRVTKDALMKDQ